MTAIFEKYLISLVSLIFRLSLKRGFGGCGHGFECLPHSLLIAKLHADGFDKTSTEYLKDYFNHRKLKTKINKTFSNWTNILHEVPQGSILGPLIFTVFLYDLFLFKPDIDLVSYADDNTPFAMG